MNFRSCCHLSHLHREPLNVNTFKLNYCKDVKVVSRTFSVGVDAGMTHSAGGGGKESSCPFPAIMFANSCILT